MKKNRWVWVGAIVIAVLVLLSLFVAPNQANLRQGSTYSRAPSGYGAWYAYMQEQGANIQRWQRPLEELVQPSIEYRKAEGRGQRAEGGVDGWMGGWVDEVNSSAISQSTAPQKQATVLSPHPISSGDASQTVLSPQSSVLSPHPSSLILHPSSLISQSSITLLQIDNGLGGLGLPSQEWIEQGNVVIQLGNTLAVAGWGVEFPVTRSPFTSVLSSAVGQVKVETSRRFTELKNVPKQVGESIVSRLADTYGAVVLERSVGEGKVITAITPHLAANAYQDEPGNFKFLAQLVTESGHPVWVDEYLHGYKDQQVIAEETSRSLLNYLANTPILLVAVQAIVLLLVLIWGLNRRLGPPIGLDHPKVDNSEAYIHALAAVLHKANCGEFVVQTIGKAEQLQVQRSLGLGNDLLDPVLVIEAWVQQTGRSASELEEVLSYADRRRFSESELLDWLGKVRSVRQHLP